MGHPTKIATCCYCGTRAALVLRGRERHELSCSACGAPLHNLKMLRTDRGGDRDLVGSRPASPAPATKPRPFKPGKKKKRRPRLASFLKEAFDVIEDIFD